MNSIKVDEVVPRIAWYFTIMFDWKKNVFVFFKRMAVKYLSNLYNSKIQRLWLINLFIIHICHFWHWAVAFYFTYTSYPWNVHHRKNRSILFSLPTISLLRFSIDDIALDICAFITLKMSKTHYHHFVQQTRH